MTGARKLIDVNSAGVRGNRVSYAPSLSATGRYAAFTSGARNLVAHDTNGLIDTFVHDRRTGRTVRVSVGGHGQQGNGRAGGHLPCLVMRLVVRSLRSLRNSASSRSNTMKRPLPEIAAGPPLARRMCVPRVVCETSSVCAATPALASPATAKNPKTTTITAHNHRRCI